MRTIKLLAAAVAMMAVLCSGAWAAPITVTKDTTRWTAGEYVVDSNVTIDRNINVVGDVTLRLNDLCSLTVNSYIAITEASSLTIEGGQDTSAGRLEVYSPGTYAAIGGGIDISGKITINGGKVKAISKGSAPGIGCMEGVRGGTLTINGGTVEARSQAGPGIGGGNARKTTLTNAPGRSAWIVVSSLKNVDTTSFNGVIFDESDLERKEQVVTGPGGTSTTVSGNFYGRIYGSGMVIQDVDFPDIPTSPSDLNYSRWVLDIPVGQKLVVAPGATLKMKAGDHIDNKGTLEINGILRKTDGPLTADVIKDFDHVDGRGAVEQGDGKKYLANNFTTYHRAGVCAYSTTLSIADPGTGCSAVAEPPFAIANSRIRLIPVPSPEYELDIWDIRTPSGISISNDVFWMPAEDVVIRAAFTKRKYAIKISNVDGGGTASAGGETAQIGSTVTLTPTANDGYEFDRWVVLTPAAGVDISQSHTFTMPASDVHIAATFRKKTYAITVQNASNGTAMANAERAASGDVVTLRVNPDDGYAFGGWQAVSPAGLSIAADRFTMPNADVSVKPTFTPLSSGVHSITVHNDGRGTASVTGGLSSAAQGTNITLTPSPDPGYEFDRWVGPDGLIISGNSFKMPNSNVVIIATFRKKVHAINVDPGVHGSAIPSRPSASSDDVITLMPKPDDGYVFASWDITEPAGLVITEGNQFNMPNSAVRVKPIFAEVPQGEHAIVVGNDGNGTGTPDPRSAASGDKVTLVPTANDGYVFDRWNVLRPAGLDISDDKFEMPDTYVVVNAIFRKIDVSSTDPTITLHNVDGGGRALATPNRAPQGTEITLTPFAKDGYDLDRWVVLDPAGLVISGNKFKMPSSDVSIVAVFKKRETATGPSQTPGGGQGTHDSAVNVDKTDGLWSADAGQDLTIYIEYDFDQFTKIVSLDGAPLKMDTANVSRDFGAREGSTVVTIWERTLKENIKTDGVHRAELGFKDRTVVVPFAAIVTGSYGGSGAGGGSGGGGCATMGAAFVSLAALAAMKRRK